MARPRKSAVAEIDKQIAKLEAQRKNLLGREKVGVVARIREAIQHYGITVPELFSGKQTAKAAAKATRRAKTTAVIKYRDGDNTWVGRGKRPTWLQEKLTAGAQLEDFLVK